MSGPFDFDLPKSRAYYNRPRKAGRGPWFWVVGSACVSFGFCLIVTIMLRDNKPLTRGTQGRSTDATDSRERIRANPEAGLYLVCNLGLASGDPAVLRSKLVELLDMIPAQAFAAVEARRLLAKLKANPELKWQIECRRVMANLDKHYDDIHTSK